MRHSLKPLLLALLISGLLLAVPMTFAQEATSAAETSSAASAPGISTLVFLLGALAILIVGGASLARDSYRTDTDEK